MRSSLYRAISCYLEGRRRLPPIISSR